MIDIAEYTDYRKFLSDHYCAVKKQHPRFSYQAFSQKTGISSKGLLYNVLKGKRHLSKSHIVGMGKALKLNRHQFDYFETLVAYNCAKKIADKNYYFERLMSIKATGRAAWQPQLVRKEQFEYYSQWYHSVIRSLIGMHGFIGDYEAMARQLYPTITPGQVKKSIELLLSLGFIVQKKGNYSIVDRTITTAAEVVSLAVHNFHAQTGGLALTALEKLPLDRRNFSSVTVGISEAMYRDLCKDIEEFRSFILKKIESDQGAENVYQINFQVFPLSRNAEERNIQ